MNSDQLLRKTKQGRREGDKRDRWRTNIIVITLEIKLITNCTSQKEQDTKKSLCLTAVNSAQYGITYRMMWVAD